MKRIIFTLAVLMLASPALAAVDITCVNDVTDCNKVTVYYDATGEDPCLVRAFAIDIVADNDVNITDVCDLSNAAYWVHPGSIVIVDGAVTNEGSVVCEPDVGPAGQTGTPDTNWITIEMASLYAATDPCHPTAPPNQGALVSFYVNGSCRITISENTVRGGVVMEDPDASPTVNLTGCAVPSSCFGWVYPDCWGYTGTTYQTQCHGDGDGSNFVDTDDWPDFRDGFGKYHPHADYQAHVCADYNRDGGIDTSDWPEFRDNFGKTPASDCPHGDHNYIYGGP